MVWVTAPILTTCLSRPVRTLRGEHPHQGERDGVTMRVAVLSSGGKDSAAAWWWASAGMDGRWVGHRDHHGRRFPMFQIPSTHLVERQAALPTYHGSKFAPTAKCSMTLLPLPKPSEGERLTASSEPVPIIRNQGRAYGRGTGNRELDALLAPINMSISGG